MSDRERGVHEKLEDALRYTAAQEGRRLTGAEADEVRASIEEILQLLE